MSKFTMRRLVIVGLAVLALAATWLVGATNAAAAKTKTPAEKPPLQDNEGTIVSMSSSIWKIKVGEEIKSFEIAGKCKFTIEGKKGDVSPRDFKAGDAVTITFTAAKSGINTAYNVSGTAPAKPAAPATKK